MSPEQQYLIKIFSRCRVDVYNSSSTNRVTTPFRLESTQNVKRSTRNRCLKFILDTGADTPDDVTDEDIIEKINTYNPDYFIPNDVFGDIDATCEAIDGFFETIEEETFNTKVLIPLQPPYVDHYEKLRNEYPGQFNRTHFVLGGMKNKTAQEQLDEIHRFREHAGYDLYAHGLGVGGKFEFIRGLRANPNLLDSLDTSTHFHMANGNRLMDVTMVRRGFFTPKGDASLTLQSLFEKPALVFIAYLLSNLCSEETFRVISRIRTQLKNGRELSQVDIDAIEERVEAELNGEAEERSLNSTVQKTLV